MGPHAPLPWRVGAELRCRVLMTRQPCRGNNNKIKANYHEAPELTEINEKTEGEKTPVAPFTVQFFVVIEGCFCLCTVHCRCEKPPEPLVTVLYFVVFEGQRRQYTVHIAAIKK